MGLYRTGHIWMDDGLQSPHRSSTKCACSAPDLPKNLLPTFVERWVHSGHGQGITVLVPWHLYSVPDNNQDGHTIWQMGVNTKVLRKKEEVCEL